MIADVSVTVLLDLTRSMELVNVMLDSSKTVSVYLAAPLVTLISTKRVKNVQQNVNNAQLILTHVLLVKVATFST